MPLKEDPNDPTKVVYVKPDYWDAFQPKELNDEEIDGLAENCWYTDEDLEIFNYKKFARLLLKKASEK